MKGGNEMTIKIHEKDIKAMIASAMKEIRKANSGLEYSPKRIDWRIDIDNFTRLVVVYLDGNGKCMEYHIVL